jgi:hypothetical protein
MVPLNTISLARRCARFDAKLARGARTSVARSARAARSGGAHQGARAGDLLWG